MRATLPALALLAPLAACTGGDPTDAATDPTAPAAAPDQADLVRTVQPYADETRTTPAGAARDLPTWAWIGAAAGEDAPHRPLLLLLHGIDGHPDKFEAFATFLAERGVVVAAPTFPVSNRDADADALTQIEDFPEQITDAAVVLDRLLADREDPDSPLHARFDPDRIVGLGHSMGGATLLGRTRYGDGEPRLVGQAYLSAAMQLRAVLELDGDELDPVGPPTLVAQGLEDDAVPPAFGEELYASIDDPRWYLGLAGADHSEALESQQMPPIPERDALQRAVLALCDTVRLGDDTVLVDVLSELGAAGHEVR